MKIFGKVLLMFSVSIEAWEEFIVSESIEYWSSSTRVGFWRLVAFKKGLTWHGDFWVVSCFWTCETVRSVTVACPRGGWEEYVWTCLPFSFFLSWWDFFWASWFSRIMLAKNCSYMTVASYSGVGYKKRLAYFRMKVLLRSKVSLVGKRWGLK